MHGINRAAAFLALTALLVCIAAGVLFGQMDARLSLRLDSGEQIFKSACVACHGPNGRRNAQGHRGFEPPRTFPDFTHCDQTTPEPNSASKAVIINGGPYTAMETQRFVNFMMRIRPTLPSSWRTPRQPAKVMRRIKDKNY